MKWKITKRIPILVSIIIFLGIAGGIYYTKESSTKIASKDPLPTQRGQLISTPVSERSFLNTTGNRFDRFLLRTCKSNDNNDHTIDASELPFHINPARDADSNKYIAKCFFDNTTQFGFASIYITNKDSIIVYNNNSYKANSQLGWPSLWCRTCENAIIEKFLDTQLKVDVTLSDGPQLLEDSVVLVMGEKHIKISGNDDFYVSFSRNVIDAGDESLVKLLSKYKEYDEDRRKYVLNRSMGTGIADDIRRTFFGDMARLHEPERSNVAYVKSILSAITP